LVDRVKVQNIHVMHYRDTITTHTNTSYGDDNGRYKKYCIDTIQEYQAGN